LRDNRAGAKRKVREMNTESSPADEFLRRVLDAMPAFVFVVDEDVSFIESNRAASKLLSATGGQILRRRSGEVLQCIHSSETPEGCGGAPYCKDCVIRNSVGEAFKGEHVVRQRAKLELVSDGKVRDFYALITASPFAHGNRRLVLLVIEDINELVELRRLTPICVKCKKIRDDDQYWSEVETYFNRHLDLDFTHGYCPDCLQEFLAEVARERAERSTSPERP